MSKIEIVKKSQEENVKIKYYGLLKKLEEKDKRFYNNMHPNEKDEELLSI